MYTDLKKTLAELEKCLLVGGEPTATQLHRMYDQTLRLMSQELGVIYDREAFGDLVGQEGRTLAGERSDGMNSGDAVTLTVCEPLPYFEKAMVEIEIVTPRGSDNARVWDTSNRAIQVVLNNLKGIFFSDDDMEHMAFSVVGRWGEKGSTVIRVSAFGEKQRINGTGF